MVAPGDQCPQCQEGELVIRKDGDTGEDLLPPEADVEVLIAL